MTRTGFPHSGICVSTPACGSSQLIAANHALHRLLSPRHPPSALTSLTTNSSAAPSSSRSWHHLRGRSQGSLFENLDTSWTQTNLYLIRTSSSIQLSGNKNFWNQNQWAWLDLN